MIRTSALVDTSGPLEKKGHQQGVGKEEEGNQKNVPRSHTVGGVENEPDGTNKEVAVARFCENAQRTSGSTEDV